MSKTQTIMPGLYFDAERNRYYARPMNERGNRTEHTFKAITKSEAIKEFVSWQKEPPAPTTTMKALIQAYIDAGAPGAKLSRQKAEDFAATEIARCGWLLQFFGGMKAHTVKFKHALEYRDWRVSKLTKKVSGGTTVDLDLGTLSNVFQHGRRLDLVTFNPMDKRERFAGVVSHCRDHCCRSGDELHSVAKALGGFLALQFLFECCSGCRTGEALSLRRDARPGQAGHIRVEEDGQRYLCLSRLKQGDQDPFDYLPINPALELVLKELDTHHSKLDRPSQWFFPGRDRVNDSPMDPCALCHALRRAAPKVLPGRRLTSHGCRAFYVTWRRYQKADLFIISNEVGHRSGVGLLLRVYGRRIPAWAEGGFSPFPSVVDPFWHQEDLLSDNLKLGRQVKKQPQPKSTNFTTKRVGIPVLPQTTPDHVGGNIIVFVGNELSSTRTG